jgi:23S rRNA (pseudouridine1915-N3)-methyltransferase
MSMQIRIITVGKIKEKFVQDGIAEYDKRLRPYAKVQIIEVADEKRPGSTSPATESAAMDKEGERILAAIPEDFFVIALDVKGRSWSSEELATSFREWELSGQNRIAFVIGGDLGFSRAVGTQSHMRLSLSPMTFTHPMARLLLLEQVYRAFRILRGEPYHK